MKLIDKLTGRSGAADDPVLKGQPGAEEENPVSPEAPAEPDAPSEPAAPAAPDAAPCCENDTERLLAELAALREEAEVLRTRLANAENRRAAPPAPPGGGDGEFYTPQDVRRMSPGEVRIRMPAIRASMEKWK